MKLKITLITFFIVLLFLSGFTSLYSQETNKLTQKTLQQDMNYFYRMCKKMKGLDSNDKLAILIRIQNKYKSTDLDLTKLENEVAKWKALKKGKKPATSITAKKKTKSKIQKTKLKIKTAEANIKEALPEPPKKKVQRFIPKLTGKTFDDDMMYYFDISQKENITDIDKLFTLYKIRDKYKNMEDIDPTILMDEIFKLEDEVSKRIGASIEGKSVDEDMLYYYKFSEEHNLNINDKLFLLYKMRDKYQGQDIDIGVINDEIKKAEENWLNEPETPPPYVTGISSSALANILYSTANVQQQTVNKIELIQQSEYMIQTGDVLGIKVYPNDEVSGEVIVRPDGTIKIPLAGTVIAQGQSIGQLENYIQKSLSRYLVSPKVTIEIRHSSENEILITGEVRNPGIYSYKDNLRLLELVAVSGGFTTSANVQEIKVYRGKRGERKVLVLNAEDVTKSGDLSKDLILQRGDIIEIQRATKKISIIGAVTTPGNYDYRDGLKVLDAVSLAGGPIQSARLLSVKVFRESETTKETFDVNLDEIMKGKTNLDKELKPSDIIFVPYKSGLLGR